MRQNWMKLTNRLKITLIGGLAVSVSLISASLTFSVYAQDNSGNDNGNYPVRQQGNGNSVGGRGNINNTRSNSPNYTNYNRNRRTTYDNRTLQNTNCNEGNFERSSCGSGSTVNNR